MIINRVLDKEKGQMLSSFENKYLQQPLTTIVENQKAVQKNHYQTLAVRRNIKTWWQKYLMLPFFDTWLKAIGEWFKVSGYYTKMLTHPEIAAFLLLLQ